jgi:hypothetical protein
MVTAPTAASVTANYSSRRHSATVVQFARSVVTVAAPPSATRAKAWLFAATQIGSFGELVGLEVSARTLLTTPVIERFVLHIRPSVSPATTLTLHSQLRALAREVTTPLSPAPLQVSRTRAHHPYSDSEMDRFVHLARHQPTLSRRARGLGLVALGAGAGLAGGDLRDVRGTDVVARSGGLVVLVSGARARVVPVLARYHEILEESARAAGDQSSSGERERPAATSRTGWWPR